MINPAFLASNLTDEELLTELNATRHLSPIIDALCRRLAARLTAEPEVIDTFAQAEKNVGCPVCYAKLEVHCDENNLQLRLEPR